MKLLVKHAEPMVLLKSTSTIHDNTGKHVTVTFQPKESVEANFRRVWNSAGYQAHRTAKDAYKGIY